MKKLILVGLFAMVLIPLKVLGAETYSIECSPNSVAPGQEKTCIVYANNASNLTQFNATVTPLGYDNITAIDTAEGWTGTKNISTGEIALTASTPIAGAKVAIVSISFKIDENWQEGDPCGINVQIGNTNIPWTPTPPNPPTGSFVPYIILSGGLILAIGLYYVATKRKKIFYNI